jgi:hypothetical protein
MGNLEFKLISFYKISKPTTEGTIAKMHSE